ncbi:MAG: CRISPR-associated endonuclease Cas1 [Anaerostipes sp.]|nr:CRISPR-associated endonuclease Cas1 [Anaerostipes sp.]
MSYLYVVEHGAVIGISGGYFVVTYKDGMIQKIPKETLESISLFGNVSLTTPCIETCLKQGIHVNFFSKRGAYYGCLESTRHTNIFRTKEQLKLTNDLCFPLEISKKFIQAKIHNQRIVLNRYYKSENKDIANCLKNIKISENKILACESSEELMGHEGFASRNYFEGLSKLVSKDFEFYGRNRMPPKDPFNSMISLGYTILMYEIYGQIESHGLNPYAGFLHTDKERHPTLASDLMEEWRAVIVDSTVMSLIQGNEISVDDFEYQEQGVFLKDVALKIFIRKMGKKMLTDTKYLVYLEERSSFRRALWHQVGRLVKCIEKRDADLYEPVWIR